MTEPPFSTPAPRRRSSPPRHSADNQRVTGFSARTERRPRGGCPPPQGASDGLEALSRGAAHATFVERDAQALRALGANVEALGVAGRARVVRRDVGRALEALGRAGERFTIIFLDPPYEDAVDAALEGVARGGLVASDGIVIAQHRTKRPPAATCGPLVLSRTPKFRETTLTLFRALQDEPPPAI